MQRKPTLIPANRVPVVAAMLVRADGQMLLQRRPAGRKHAGSWEFPGGKVEPGETGLEALARELYEELGIVMDADSATLVGGAGEDDGPIRLDLYRIEKWEGEPVSLENAQVRWLDRDDALALPLCALDRKILSDL